MTWLVDLVGLALLVFIVWWFWLSGPQMRRSSGGLVEILVDGGVYSPARIETPAGRPITLRFIRKDPNPCAEKVIFDALNLSRDLALDRPEDIAITPQQPGEYEFTCQMGMYRGKLVVS